MWLSFRSPGVPLPLVTLLARALPEATPGALQELVQGRAVTLDGSCVRDPTSDVAPGRRVEVDRDGIARELAEKLGFRSGDTRAAEWNAEDHGSARALVPEPPWRSGTLSGRGRCAIHFEVKCTRGAVAEIAVSAASPVDSEDWLANVRGILARAGFPVLGDARRGGVLADGGERLVACTVAEAAGPAPASWWPEEPVFFEREEAGGLPVLGVSRATRRVLERGHPWVLADAATDDNARFAPGTLVSLRAGGVDLGLGHVEGGGRLVARTWARQRRRRDAASVEARVAAALDRRASLLSPPADAPTTDAFRLVHGEADGLPGLAVDRLGPLLRVLITSPGTDGYRTRVIDALLHRLGGALGSDAPVVEVLHLRDRPAGALECVRLERGDPATLALSARGRHVVRERGIAFEVDAGLARPERSSPGVGLYLDQRDNRARLAARARTGGRWLNLFAHTGAFSAVLLHAGADEVVSVDLSQPYLRWLDDNLARNGFDDDRHRGVRHDGRRYLERLTEGERFAGIVLDPPTAAAAGRRFWSVAKELPPLVAEALSRLEPGGVLLVSRNDRQRGGLEALIREAAQREQVRLEDVQPAPPGADFPALSGFPEGDPFSAVLATRAL